MNNLAYQTQPKQRPHVQPKQRRQVKPKVRYGITPGEKLIIFLCVCIFAVCAITVVSNYAAIYQVNNEIHSLEVQIDEQMKNNGSLGEEIAHLSKPERILKIASQYGLSINEDNIKVIYN